MRIGGRPTSLGAATRQFIRLTVDYDKKKRTIKVPRQLVHVIIEGKNLDKESIGFVKVEEKALATSDALSSS